MPGTKSLPFAVPLLSVLLCTACEWSAQPTESTIAPVAKERVQRAVCVLVPIGGSNVSGIIAFSRENNQIRVTGEITGLSPGEHGFHVHAFGDLTDREGGESAGSHYNPTGQRHGRMDDKARHVGDLGNIEADETGIARVNLIDHVIQLDGDQSIIGRSLIVHAESDKFTQPTGDAGGRVAAGVIGIAEVKPVKP